LAIETLAGIIRPRLVDGMVEVDMGEPILEGKDIPTTLEGKVFNRPLQVDGHDVEITCVSMGNPHCVIFVDAVAQAPVTSLGPILEKHPLFPKRSNVEFVQVLGPAELNMRVWERGVGETLACGSGACAVMVAAHVQGLVDDAVDVRLPGGTLRIEWPGNGNVNLTGPAVKVFESEWAE
ncbi:MAG: diaminopimelate epimerase, partial [Dehalococcoidia bacterium]